MWGAPRSSFRLLPTRISLSNCNYSQNTTSRHLAIRRWLGWSTTYYTARNLDGMDKRTFSNRFHQDSVLLPTTRKTNFLWASCLFHHIQAWFRGLCLPTFLFNLHLELQGAVLGVRLCDSAIKELGPIATQVVYWCDSQTVLQWIHFKSCKYHEFVAHQITEILDKSAASQWRHIPGELNPTNDC
jgi:hypothetical protein